MQGDYQPAYNAELWSPSGLALDKDQRCLGFVGRLKVILQSICIILHPFASKLRFLYIADAGSHRVRRIDLAQTPLNAGGGESEWSEWAYLRLKAARQHL